MNRSLRGLDAMARETLEAAALLAHAPFPLAAIDGALGGSRGYTQQVGRQALKALVQANLLRLAPELAEYWQFTRDDRLLRGRCLYCRLAGRFRICSATHGSCERRPGYLRGTANPPVDSRP